MNDLMDHRIVASKCASFGGRVATACDIDIENRMSALTQALVECMDAAVVDIISTIAGATNKRPDDATHAA